MKKETTMNHFKILFVLTGLFSFTLAAPRADTSAEDTASPIRVLILTGRNNHNWKETTPVLQNLLEASSGCVVDTVVPPQGLTEDNLQNYDLILSNWNSWGNGSKEAEA